MAGRDGEAHREAQAPDSHVDPDAQATARTTNGLIFSRSFSPCRMMVGANNGRINDRVFEDRIAGQHLEQLSPDPSGTPSAEAANAAVPFAKHFK